MQGGEGGGWGGPKTQCLPSRLERSREINSSPSFAATTPVIGSRTRRGEDEVVGWHHGLNGHESEQTPGDSEGQESLVCCMRSMG